MVKGKVAEIKHITEKASSKFNDLKDSVADKVDKVKGKVAEIKHIGDKASSKFSDLKDSAT